MKHKPSYHFRPEQNWINDLNGPIYFEGKYHLFYQYNPSGYQWGNLHWGHAVSGDMVHWSHLEPALYPEKDRGENFCFSGCAYENDGRLEIFYTSVGSYGHGERGHIEGAEQWIAVTEDMKTWKQIDENPILSPEQNRRQGKYLTHWRDPFVFQYGGEILMVISGIVDGWKAAFHIYQSKDYRNWEYKNCFYTECRTTIYECPNVMVFGEKIVFVYTCFQENAQYVVGTLNEDYSLHVTRHGEIIDSGCFCASNVFKDPKGRYIMWGWLREDDRNELITDGPWSGAISLPRVVTLEDGDMVSFSCAEEVKLLRKLTETHQLCGFSGTKKMSCHSMTAEVECFLKTDGDIRIRVLDSEDGTEYTDIWILSRAKTIWIYRERSSVIPEVVKDSLYSRYRGDEQHVSIRAFIENSVLEVFVNDSTVLSGRVYPVNDRAGISFTVENGTADGCVNLYQMTDS